MGIDVVYLGREDRAHHIAAVAVEESVDAVELYMGGAGGVRLLRELLRELTQVGRRSVSMVVHRLE